MAPGTAYNRSYTLRRYGRWPSAQRLRCTPPPYLAAFGRSIKKPEKSGHLFDRYGVCRANIGAGAAPYTGVRIPLKGRFDFSRHASAGEAYGMPFGYFGADPYAATAEYAVCRLDAGRAANQVPAHDAQRSGVLYVDTHAERHFSHLIGFRSAGDEKPDNEGPGRFDSLRVGAYQHIVFYPRCAGRQEA